MGRAVHAPDSGLRWSTALAIALAYPVLGALGLSLAIPPGFASPVFPAAGFALACVLLFGPSAAVCVWFGSLVLNLGVLAQAGNLDASTLPAPALVATGAALQAWLGAHWIQRGGEAWRTLDNERTIVRFVLRGGVLACLVSASVAVGSLVLADVIAPGAWAFNWWSWYTGDLIGVVTFAPLTLLVLSPGDPLWRERRWRVGLPIVAALVLAMVSFGTVSHWEQKEQETRLQQDGQALARLVRNRLIAHQEILASLRRFIEATPDFSYSQFETFTRISLADNPDLFALSFNDLVRGQDLPDYERRIARLSPVPGFLVTERDARGQLVPVQPREQHVVVRYIAPLKGNLPAIGFDIGSEPLRRDAIGRARASDAMAVTAPIRLVQEAKVRMGVLALEPLEAGAPGRQAPRERGFVVAVTKVDELVDIAVKGQVPTGVFLSVSDPQAAPGADRFYPLGVPEPSDVKLQWSTPLTMGDRQWLLEVRATTAYQGAQRTWLAWAVGVAGLLFAGLLQVYLLAMTGRAAFIRRQNQTLLANQAELQLADAVFKNAGEAVVVLGRSGAIISVNPAFARITGYAPGAAKGRPLAMLEVDEEALPPQDPAVHRPPLASARAIMHALAQDQRWQGEWWNRRRDGSHFPCWWTFTAVLDDSGRPSLYVGTFSDISEQKKAQQQIEFLAYHDALTSLPNRVMGRQRAVEAIGLAQREGTRVAVLFMDVDHFKLVNDTYGHSVGDRLLQCLAVRLRAQLRDQDSLCRLSGDEFMVILQDAGEPAQVVMVCERILRQVAAPVEIDGHQLQVSMSLGVAMFPQDGQDPESLLRNADTALFQAKQAGRNTVRLFDAYMNEDVVRFVTLRDQIQQALRDGEFELHYQPQLSLADGRVMGVEALVRWRSHEQGLLLPREFIEVAEESGLIVPMGEWVLREACRQMAQWRAQGLGIPTMAVNLSAVQLRKPGLEALLAQALQESGLPASCLELELTESLLINDRESMLSVLARLRGQGVRLSIDDFGTGYSSLAYLKLLKVDKIKIDRSFAADVAVDPEDAAIVRAIVSMAGALGLQTVAEGVETEAAQAVLRELGCAQVQGFLHAHPMSAEDFAGWLEARAGAVAG